MAVALSITTNAVRVFREARRAADKAKSQAFVAASNAVAAEGKEVVRESFQARFPQGRRRNFPPLFSTRAYDRPGGPRRNARIRSAGDQRVQDMLNRILDGERERPKPGNRFVLVTDRRATTTAGRLRARYRNQYRVGRAVHAADVKRRSYFGALARSVPTRRWSLSPAVRELERRYLQRYERELALAFRRNSTRRR